MKTVTVFSVYRFSEFLVKKNTKTFQGTSLMDLLLIIIFFCMIIYVFLFAAFVQVRENMESCKVGLCTVLKFSAGDKLTMCQ